MSKDLLGAFTGIKIVSCPELSKIEEDWSSVRSPSRAKRRRRQGHHQRIKTKVIPNDTAVIDQTTGTVYVHPAKMADLRRALDQQERLEKTLKAPPETTPIDTKTFAYAHLGVWSANGRIKRFDRFPVEMGGALAQAKILDAAEDGGIGRLFYWMLPNRDDYLGVSAFRPADEKSLATADIIAFRAERLAYEGRVKTILVFADDDSERRFTSRTSLLRMEKAKDDERWGLTDLPVPPSPKPTWGSYRDRFGVW